MPGQGPAILAALIVAAITLHAQEPAVSGASLRSGLAIMPPPDEGHVDDSFPSMARLDLGYVVDQTPERPTGWIYGAGLALTWLKGRTRPINASDPTMDYELTALPLTVRLGLRHTITAWLDVETCLHGGIGPTFVALSPGRSIDGSHDGGRSGNTLGFSAEYGASITALVRCDVHWSVGAQLMYIRARQTFAYALRDTTDGSSEQHTRHLDQTGLSPAVVGVYRW